MTRTNAANRLSRIARLGCIAIALVVVVPVVPGSVTPAMAQQSGERSGGGLLRFLFPRATPPREERAAPSAKPRQNTPRRATTGTRREPGAAQATAPALDKAEDAKRVLVVGDFLAGGLAEGLVSAFEQNANVVVVDRSNGSSGLVRDDHFDWPGKIGEVIDAEKPAVVIVMIGSNDRQQMRVGDTREPSRSEAWTAEYERRVTALTKGVRGKNLPLIWVGNLPFRPGAMSSDMVAFNDIYRRIVTDAGGEFIDVWDGFVDETGSFAANGPDMNGQPAQLRSSDGINVTRHGRRKIAFYAERPLARLLGAAATPETARLSDPLAPGAVPTDSGESGIPDANQPALSIPARIDRTAPIGIDDPQIDDASGSGLLGGNTAPRDDNGSSKEGGESGSPDTRPGRADDFTMRRVTPATDPQTTTAVAR